MLELNRYERAGEEFKLPFDLETIYQTYPRHKDKRFALASIGKALQRIVTGETGKKMTAIEAQDYLLARTAEFSRSPAGNLGTMTPYPATWFNRGAYMDDACEWNCTKKSNGGNGEYKTADQLRTERIEASFQRALREANDSQNLSTPLFERPQ